VAAPRVPGVSSNWFGPGEALTAVVALAVLPAGILTGLFAGLLAAVGVVAVGYLFVLPATAIVLYSLGAFATDPEDWEDGEPPTETVSDHTDRDAVADERDPLETLRERYARGELGDEEFERKLDRMIATEDDTPEDGALSDATTDEEFAFER